MAIVKITELPAISTISDTDVLPIADVSELETKKITGSQLRTYAQGTLPTDVTKLDNVTKYLTATAGSNGDFKVNIPNTLATGMILNITFPTATLGSANARLSIDNGVTYKNIYDSSIILKANQIQGKNITLIFNGTNFICECEYITYIYKLSSYMVDGFTVTSAQVVKKNQKVVINFNIDGTFPANTSTTVANLPADLCPTATVYGTATCASAGVVALYAGYNAVTSTGAFVIRSASSAALSFGSITYDII